MPTLLTVITIHPGKEHINRAIVLMMLILGLVSLLGSAFYTREIPETLDSSSHE